MMRNLHVSHIQLDELWAFVGKKQRRVQPGEWDKGDLYTFLAVDLINKAILTYSTGRRDTYTTRLFIEDLRARVLGSPMVSSDGFSPYEEGHPLDLRPAGPLRPNVKTLCRRTAD